MSAIDQLPSSDVLPAGVTLSKASDGAAIAHVRCVNCDRPVDLPCREEYTGKPVRPPMLALKFARLIWCASCADRAETERLEGESQRARDDRAREAKIPPTFRGLRWEDMHASSEHRTRAIERLQEWSSSKDAGGVLLYGGVGVGKTRLAATATWARLARYRVHWVSVAVLFANLTAAFSTDERKEALRVLTGVGPLVLDDLDKIALGENSRSHLFVAIDRRITAGAPLLVTSNLTPRELAERFGEAIASRINGYCGAFELDGPDHRLALEV